VGDSEAVPEKTFELAASLVAVLPATDEHVRRQCWKARRDRPDVEVVHLDDTRGSCQPSADGARLDALRRAFQEDRRRITQDRPRAREDEDADEHADDRVRLQPARRENDHGRDGDTERAEEIGQDVPKRTLDVETVPARPVQDRPRREIDPHSEDRDQQHPAGKYRLGALESSDRLDEDPDRERHERDAVGERSENFRALVTERSLGRGRLRGKPHGHQRQSDRHIVRHHVHGVRENRETPGENAPDHLDHRERSCYRERQRERTSTSRRGVVVVSGSHQRRSTGKSGRSSERASREARALAGTAARGRSTR